MKKRKRIYKQTIDEKIIELRKQLGLDLRKEKRNETFRFNTRAVNIGRFDWVRAN